MAGGIPAVAGLMGKIPATGDFVLRQIPEGFHGIWDGWVSRHLVPLSLPPDGLNFRISSGGRAVAGVVLASQDAIGRAFPLSLVLLAPALPGPEALAPWCAAARAAARPALAGREGADALRDRLEALPVPDGAMADPPPFLLWTAGSAALAVDRLAPGPALAALGCR